MNTSRAKNGYAFVTFFFFKPANVASMSVIGNAMLGCQDELVG